MANVREAHRVWREGSKLPKFARASLAPIGTTFSFTLNQAARVRFAFRQILARRRPLRGVLTYSARAGAHRLRFQGSLSRHKKLNPGRYTLTITAANAAGQQATATLRFKITR